MNTLIYLWIKPLIINHKRGKGRLYFDVIVEGDHTSLSKDGLDKFIEGGIMSDIMDFADIDSNWNYKCISAVATNLEPQIINSVSPSQRKADEKLGIIVSGKEELHMGKKDMEISHNGKNINISLPALKRVETIDFSKIWDTLQKDFLGKIQEGDTVSLTDDAGNKLFDIKGGSFLNVALGDILIRDGNGQLKGGLYIRDDGSIDIGDFNRTLYLKIYTQNLLTQSFRVNKSLSDLTLLKLSENIETVKS